jgi:hypothetical protein
MQNPMALIATENKFLPQPLIMQTVFPSVLYLKGAVWLNKVFEKEVSLTMIAEYSIFSPKL